MDQQNSLTNIGILLHSEKWKIQKCLPVHLKILSVWAPVCRATEAAHVFSRWEHFLFRAFTDAASHIQAPRLVPGGLTLTSHSISFSQWRQVIRFLLVVGFLLWRQKSLLGAAIITWLVSVTQTQIHTRTSTCTWSLLKYIAMLWIATLMGFTFVPLVFFYRKCLLNSSCIWLSFLNFSLF